MYVIYATTGINCNLLLPMQMKTHLEKMGMDLKHTKYFPLSEGKTSDMKKPNEREAPTEAVIFL